MNKGLKILVARTLVACTLLSFAGLPNSVVKAEGINANVASKQLTPLDILYKGAYDTTVQALSDRTQLSINKARIAIKLLESTEAAWAIGEFSKQVDSIQHPIYVRVYNAIVKAQLNPTQANINSASELLDKNMPEVYRNSYSSAVDKIQQDLIKKTLDDINKALSSKLGADITAAQKLIAELKTSVSEDVKDWVAKIDKDFTERVTIINNSGGTTGGSNGSGSGSGTVITPPVDPYAFVNETGTHTGNFTISSRDDGTFGPTTGTNNIVGNLTLDVDATAGQLVKLSNLNITGTLTVDFGDGDVTLENVVVNGLNVSNVGSNSLHLTGNTAVTNLTVTDSNGDARIVVENNSYIATANVESGASLQVAQGATHLVPYGTVNVQPSAENNNEPIIIASKVAVVNVNATSKVELTATANITSKVDIKAPVEMKTVVGATVASVAVNTTNATDKITFDGSVDNVVVSKGCDIEVKSGVVEVTSNTNEVVALKALEGTVVNVVTTGSYKPIEVGSGVVNIKSSSTDISSFIVSGQVGNSIIDTRNRTVTFTMPFGTNVTALTAEAKVRDGGRVLGMSGALNYTTPQVVNVEDGMALDQTQWTITCQIAQASSAKDLVSTTIGTITAGSGTKTIAIPTGTTALQLKNAITVSPFATVRVLNLVPNQAPTVVVDSLPVVNGNVIEVTAQNGGVIFYRVSVAALSSAKEIISSTVGALNNSNVFVMNKLANVGELKASLTLSEYATAEVVVHNALAALPAMPGMPSQPEYIVLPDYNIVDSNVLLQITAQDGSVVRYGVQKYVVSSAKGLISTTVGTIKVNGTGGTYIDVVGEVTIAELKSAIVVSPKATVKVFDEASYTEYPSDVVNLRNGMIIVVTAEDGTKAEYGIYVTSLITLKGTSIVQHTQGTAYTDAGVTVANGYNYVEVTYSKNGQSVAGVDVSTVGDYTVTYKVFSGPDTDTARTLLASASRVVKVVAAQVTQIPQVIYGVTLNNNHGLELVIENDATEFEGYTISVQATPVTQPRTELMPDEMVIPKSQTVSSILNLGNVPAKYVLVLFVDANNKIVSYWTGENPIQSQVVNKAFLQDSIDMAEALNKDIYTASSWQASHIADILADAKTTIALPNVTQAVIDNLHVNLTVARNSLITLATEYKLLIEATAIGQLTEGENGITVVSSIPTNTFVGDLVAGITLANRFGINIQVRPLTTEGSVGIDAVPLDAFVTDNMIILVTTADGEFQYKVDVVTDPVEDLVEITGLTIGAIHDGYGAIEQIPTGTTVGQLRNAITVTQGATLSIVDSNDVAITDDTLVLTGTMKVVVSKGTIEHVSTVEYSLQFDSENTTVDVTALNNLIDSYMHDPLGVKEAKYTIESWAHLVNVCNTANIVVLNTNSTQVQIDAQIPLVQAAIDALEEKVIAPINTVDLQHAIDSLEALIPSTYTQDSWINANIEFLLDTANTLIVDAQATQAEINTLVDDINSALDSLEEKPTGLSNTILATKQGEIAKVGSNYQIQKILNGTTADRLLADLTLAEGVTVVLKTSADIIPPPFAIVVTGMHLEVTLNENTEIWALYVGSDIPVSIDKTALHAEMQEVVNYREYSYTVASWEAYMTAYTAAYNVDQNVNATQAQIDKATTDLDTAQKALVEKEVVVPVDNSALFTKIESAKILQVGDYKAESWALADLVNAIPSAELVYYNTASTQSEIDAAIIELDAAVSKLVDGVKPLLHYSGSSLITVVNGGSLVEPLVTATDNKDGDITASIVKTIKLSGNVVTDVDTLVSGTYEFTYTVTDAAGNSSTTLPINVVVEEAVVEAATLVSVDYTDVPVSVEYGTPIFMMGAMEILKYEINITTSKGARQLSAVWDEGEKAGKVYDANVPGTYVITATLVGDHLNNPSNINLEVTQTIIVKAQVAPKSSEKELKGTDYMNAEYIPETNSLRIFEGMPVYGALSSIEVSEKATAQIVDASNNVLSADYLIVHTNPVRLKVTAEDGSFAYYNIEIFVP
jgi:hypothetical protein